MINKGKELVNEDNKNIKARTNIKISMINKKYFFDHPMCFIKFNNVLNNGSTCIKIQQPLKHPKPH